jgi:Kef-type K+ transport system membrane component KefB/mannitol/fructose-specific phosphotransferase system IIA component (Ntr-type)
MSKSPRRFRVIALVFFFIILVSAPVAAEEIGGAGESITHHVTLLVIQLAVILYSTWIGGNIAARIRLPRVLGQLITGIIIGPFLLGSIALPGFPGGLFPIVEGTVPVSPLIYSLSSLAAIILLFIAGLETDLPMFLRFAAKGTAVGFGGVIVSFILGNWLTTIYTGHPMYHPMPLFMGTLSVATSVGITASILSDQRKMDSPEGVVILSAAVIDDVMAIIILAVVLGIASLEGGTDALNWGEIAWVAFRAIGVWLFFTVLGLIFARKLSKLLKNTFKDQSLVTVMAFGLALLMAGIFESAGLSMIIGAYVVGLSLSNTDLAYMVQSRLNTLRNFFVPIFFAVSGMMVNLEAILSWEVLGFGVLFTLVTMAAKLIGAGGPAMLLNFNLLGAARIGFGMVPRGEVTLIVAGIGMGAGIISEQLFGITLLMTILSTVAAPPALNLLLKNKKSGEKTQGGGIEKTETSFSFQSPEFAQLVLTKFISEMEKEGFFVNNMGHGEEVIQMRKDEIFISLYLHNDGTATFLSDSSDVNLFKTALYESLLSVNKAAAELQKIFKPADLVKSVTEGSTRSSFDIMPYTSVERVILKLEANEKNGVIQEMLDAAERAGMLSDAEQARKDVFDREDSMSTGMAMGIALPHAKTTGVQKMGFLIALKPEGIDFKSLDGQPAQIFIMILTPAQGHGPHIQLMSAITGILNRELVRGSILTAETSYEVLRVLEAAQREGQKEGRRG